MPRATASRGHRSTSGAFLRHGNAYPTACCGFFDRRRGMAQRPEIHEHVCVDGAVKTLRGDLAHYAYRPRRPVGPPGALRPA